MKILEADMARLTEAERAELRRVAAWPHCEPPLLPEDRFVAPTLEARKRYILWVSQASRFCRQDKPMPDDGGDGWRL
jgi:hypothetical protein